MQKMQQNWKRKRSQLESHQSGIELLIFLCISFFNFSKGPFPGLIDAVSVSHVVMPVVLPIFHVCVTSLYPVLFLGWLLFCCQPTQLWCFQTFHLKPFHFLIPRAFSLSALTRAQSFS